MNYLIIAMKRSGHHLIMDWIKAHTGQKIYNDCCYGWRKKELRTVYNKVLACSGIANLEDFDYNDWKKFDFPSFPFVKDAMVIVVIRSAKNWLASSFKTKDRVRHDRRIYYTQLYSRFVDDRNTERDSRIDLYKRLVKNSLNHYVISFDRFVSDKLYRNVVAEYLELIWMENRDKECMNTCAVGSSFSRMKKKNNAKNMDVLNRYRAFENNSEFQSLLKLLEE